MSYVRMCGNVAHISEFSPASWGESRNGTCTQASAAMCLTSANNLSTQPQAVIDLMLSMRDKMYERGECSENGAATIANMAKELRTRGADVAIEWDYQGDRLSQDWHQLLKDNAGIKPILLQVSNAKALCNAAGAAQDSGVQYHAIAVLGIANQGYIVADPNNANVQNSFDTYPYWAIDEANPCGLIMLNPISMSLPSGWVDDGKNSLSYGAIMIQDGFREWLLAHREKLTAFGEPLTVPYPTNDVSSDGQHGAGAQIVFERGGLGWTAKEGVFELWLGTMFQHAIGRLDADKNYQALQQIKTIVGTL